MHPSDQDILAISGPWLGRRLWLANCEIGHDNTEIIPFDDCLHVYFLPYSRASLRLWRHVASDSSFQSLTQILNKKTQAFKLLVSNVGSYIFTTFLNIPSQCFPWYLLEQVQRKPSSSSSTQVPSFWQGWDSHLEIFSVKNQSWRQMTVATPICSWRFAVTFRSRAFPQIKCRLFLIVNPLDQRITLH